MLPEIDGLNFKGKPLQSSNSGTTEPKLLSEWSMCLTTRELSGRNCEPLVEAGVPTWKSYLSVLLYSSLVHYSIFCVFVNPLNRPLSAFKLLFGDSGTTILGPTSPCDIK